MTSRWRRSTIGGVILQCDYGLSCGLSTEPIGVPILRMGNLLGGRVSLDDLKYVPREKVSEKHLLQPGDLLLNRTNSLDLVGKVGLFAVDSEITFASYLFRLRADAALADARWLAQLLGSPSYQARLRELATPGVSQANINRDVLRSVEVPLPPLPEQRKIATILSSVDDAVEATQAVIEQLAVVKKAMMAELLTRGLPGQHTKFKMTEIGEVPEEWAVVPVSSLGEVQLGKMRSPVHIKGRLRPYLRVANVLDDVIRPSDVLEMLFEDREWEKFRLREGDIVLNEGQSLELVGRSAIYRGIPSDCAFQKTLLRFRAYPGVLSEFMQAQFQLCLYSGRFAENAVQTTSIAHLTGVRFAAMHMVRPPIEEQHEIARILGGLSARIESELAAGEALRNVKDCLMSVLLTGEVRVKPNEEAA